MNYGLWVPFWEHVVIEGRADSPQAGRPCITQKLDEIVRVLGKICLELLHRDMFDNEFDIILALICREDGIERLIELMSDDTSVRWALLDSLCARSRCGMSYS